MTRKFRSYGKTYIFGISAVQLILISLIVGVVYVPDSLASPGADKRMNVLMLIIDDLNTWLLNKPERYSGKVIAPNIKRLADSGVNFTKAYTASPKCSPSRTAFLMGVEPWKSGHTDNSHDIKNSELLGKATSFLKLFQENGYHMTISGKVSHGYYGTGVKPDKYQKHTRDPHPPGAPLNGFAKNATGKVTERDWGPTHLKETEMSDTKIADCAIETLKMEHTKPFFIACGLFHPHMPWYVPQKYFDMYPLDEITVPPFKEDDLDDIPACGQKLIISRTYKSALKHNEYKKGVQGYLATTTYADAQMGRVLDTLAKSPYMDNTMVVLFSDHGFHVGEKRHWQKGSLWEDGTNVLLMFRVPGMTKAKQICSSPVSLLDLYPTITGIAGLAKPDYVAGRSLIPLLKDVNTPHNYPVYTAYQNHITVRTAKHRLIRYQDGGIEFYDCEKDPNEWTNQANNPEFDTIKNKLAASLPQFEMLPYVGNTNSGKKEKK